MRVHQRRLSKKIRGVDAAGSQSGAARGKHRATGIPDAGNKVVRDAVREGVTVGRAPSPALYIGVKIRAMTPSAARPIARRWLPASRLRASWVYFYAAGVFRPRGCFRVARDPGAAQ